MAYFGDEYEVKLGKTTALRLADKPVNAGYEVVIATATVKRDGMDFKCELCVANIYGGYQVHCCNQPKDQWLQTFMFCPVRLAFFK